MSKTITNDITHCVINSGYTKRLVALLGFDMSILIKKDEKYKEGDMHQNSIYEISCSKESKEYENLVEICENIFMMEDDTVPLLDNFVFIKDTLWGKGIYYVNDNNVDKILNMITDNDGIICFKCTNTFEAIQNVTVLKELDYCAYGGTNSICDIEIIEKDDIKILVLTLDTESG
jgi:hypothetical protein